MNGRVSGRARSAFRGRAFAAAAGCSDPSAIPPGEPAGPPRTRKEVAMRLGLTVAQVRSDEARAMTHLRARLAKVGGRAPRRSS